MSWDSQRSFTRSAPLWEQIADRLRQAIAGGEFASGSALPTEADINAAFGVSRTTSRAAMDKLVQEGLVIRRAGIGSVLADKKIDRTTTQLSGFSADMQRRGLTPSYIVLRSGMERPSPEAAEALGLPGGDVTFVSERLLIANGRVIGLSESWLRPDLFFAHPPPSHTDLSTHSLYDWLSQTLGVEITGGVEHIEAAIASEAICTKLELALVQRSGVSASVPICFVMITRRARHSKSQARLAHVLVTWRG